MMKNEPLILKNCTCYNCDCMEVMKDMPDNSVDFILSDIPYDLDLNGGGSHGDFAQESKFSHERKVPFTSCRKALTTTRYLASLSVSVKA